MFHYKVIVNKYKNRVAQNKCRIQEYVANNMTARPWPLNNDMTNDITNDKLLGPFESYIQMQ